MVFLNKLRKEEVNMPVVRFSLSEEYYKKLEDMVKADGTSMQDYIRKKLFNLENVFTPAEAMKRALASYKQGETFTLPELYIDEWNLDKGTAGAFGKEFKRYVMKKHPGKIRQIKGERNRRALYEII